MLKNIKSTYITKILFSFLDEKIKLMLVKYNQTLQKEINICLINYQLFITSYIENIDNSKGKEYNIYNKKLIFEGEYKNGKRNGYGKEYDNNGNQIFEGRYSNGKRYGRGMEFNENYNKIFEGEYKNGKRNGKGKEYYSNYFKHIYVNQVNEIKLKFEGEYLNGKRWTGKGYDFNKKLAYEIKNGNGFIKEYNDNGKLKYEGNYLNGDKYGKGKEYFSNGKLAFEGEYKNGLKWTGKGYDIKGNITYEINNGKGKIKEYYTTELKFDGEYLYGKRNGKGKEYYLSGRLKFEGNYINGERNGKGKEYYLSGKIIFEGEYLYGHKIKGKEYDMNGKLIFNGEYLYDYK